MFKTRFEKNRPKLAQMANPDMENDILLPPTEGLNEK